ncbi:MAG: hypothetical protein RTU63_14580 [Candidatus Thorarchaeota archaeon]
MTDASDYYDFVHKLGELVLKDEPPILVVYFAIHHSILALEYKLIDMIREKYGDKHLILCPNLFMSSAFQGTVEDIKKVHEMADAILASEPEDWIALEMNFMKFEADMRNYPTTVYKTSTMERIRELIDSNPDFGFYEIILNDYLAHRAHHDGDTDGRLRCINEGIRLAKKFDDQLRVAHLLLYRASFFKGKEAREILEQAYDIADSILGIPADFANIIHYLSISDLNKGDFDNAIKRSLQSVGIRERAGLNTGNSSMLLSVIYNIIDEPESGLEWACMAEDQFKSRQYMINRGILAQIWSLILLERLTEAEILLNTTRESVLKSGDEFQLALLHFVTGIWEMHQGNFSLAASSIEQALTIFEQYSWSYYIHLMSLHHLAKIEVYSSDTIDVVAPSLAILEEKAMTEDLPGVLGQVLLLKAEIAIRNKDDSSLREIIQHLQLLIEKEKLQFLQSYLDRLLVRL